MIVHFEKSCVNHATTASMTAIQSAIRNLRACSQRPVRDESCSMVDVWPNSITTTSTVPRRHRDPDLPLGTQSVAGGARILLAQKEAEHRRARTRDVGTERTEPAELARERRRREVVRGQRPEVGGTPNANHPVDERRALLVEVAAAVALVERLVDR